MRLPMPGRPWFACIAMVAACRAGDDAPREPTAAAAPYTVALAAPEYRFAAPASLPSGWPTVRRAHQGSAIHYAFRNRKPSRLLKKSSSSLYGSV